MSYQEQPSKRLSGKKPEHVEPLLVRVEAAAEILSVGRTKVYQLMSGGQLAYLKIGSARRIPMQALKDWVAANIYADDDSPNTSH